MSNAVHKALEAAEHLSNEVSVEVLDPRTLDPLDTKAITGSIKKTGSLLVVQEGGVKAGFGAEVVRQVSRDGYRYLKYPPLVLGARDVPVPFSPVLEKAYTPQVEDIINEIRKILNIN